MPVSGAPCAGPAAAQRPDGGVLMPETRNDTAVTWAAMSAAVALLTARRAGAGDRQADVIGDVPPGQVITALEIIADGAREVRT